VFELTLSN